MRPPMFPKVVPIDEHDSKQTKILKQCFNHLVEYREPKTYRIVIQLFMCLPSRKSFPEYFDIIDRPISMYEIRKRIESNYYSCEDDCIADFKLMFKNCRDFNEESSQIYQDAVNLEKMLLKKHGLISSSQRYPIKGLKKDPNAPKKRLLTGYIIYAAEVRKEYVDKYPNEDFAFVSRLIGHDWKKLSLEDKISYDQRASAQNEKLQEKILRNNMLTEAQTDRSHLSFYAPPLMTNGTSNPKVTKKMLAKLARKQANKSFINHLEQSTPIKPTSQANLNLGEICNTTIETTEMATQTARLRFVKPPTKRHLDFLDKEDSSSKRPADLSKWLKEVGMGRHESIEAALWTLRDFMLLDTTARKFNMQPYLSH